MLQGRILALERLATAALLDMAVRQTGDSYKAKAEKLRQVIISSAQHMELPASPDVGRIQESFGRALRITLDNVVDKAATLDSRPSGAKDLPN